MATEPAVEVTETETETEIRKYPEDQRFSLSDDFWPRISIYRLGSIRNKIYWTLATDEMHVSMPDLTKEHALKISDALRLMAESLPDPVEPVTEDSPDE